MSLVPNLGFEDLANDLLIENSLKEEDQTHGFVSLWGTLHITLLDFKSNLDKPKKEKSYKSENDKLTKDNVMFNYACKSKETKWSTCCTMKWNCSKTS